MLSTPGCFLLTEISWFSGTRSVDTHVARLFDSRSAGEYLDPTAKECHLDNPEDRTLFFSISMILISNDTFVDLNVNICLCLLESVLLVIKLLQHLP